MVVINIFDHIQGLSSNAKFKTKSFEEIKKEIQELHEYDVILEELEKSNFFAPENSIHINNDTLIQFSSAISKIRQSGEIKYRLNSLSYSVGWLKNSVLLNDKDIANKAITNIIQNEHSSISSVVSELNNLKGRIDNLEGLHISLLKSGLSLDVKALLEQDFKEKHEKLNDFYNKQKGILLNLSSIFIDLTKEIALKKKNNGPKLSKPEITKTFKKGR